MTWRAAAVATEDADDDADNDALGPDIGIGISPNTGGANEHKPFPSPAPAPAPSQLALPLSLPHSIPLVPPPTSSLRTRLRHPPRPDQTGPREWHKATQRSSDHPISSSWNRTRGGAEGSKPSSVVPLLPGVYALRAGASASAFASPTLQTNDDPFAPADERASGRASDTRERESGRCVRYSTVRWYKGNEIGTKRLQSPWCRKQAWKRRRSFKLGLTFPFPFFRSGLAVPRRASNVQASCQPDPFPQERGIAEP